jgi:hypothetical protein
MLRAMTARPMLLRAGAASLLLSIPIASWWLIGDQSEEFGDYYTVDPLQIDLGDERTFGAVALAIGIVGLALLLASRSPLLSPPTRRERAILAVAGAEVAGTLTYRVLTAGVEGANIGGGLLLVGGPAAIGFLLAWALEQVDRLHAFGTLASSRKEIVLRLTVAHFALGILHPWVPSLLLGGAIAFVGALVIVAPPTTVSSPDAR